MLSSRESVLGTRAVQSCEPWCASHHDPASGLDDGVCRSRTIEVGEHHLHLKRDACPGEAVVRVASPRAGRWIELDDAPWLTSLLSSLLDVATTTAPAESEAVGVVAGLVGTTRQEVAETLGLDLEKASRRQAERIAGALAIHGVTIAD